MIKENDKKEKSLLVIDVGEAQLAKKFASMSKRGGTLEYMAPERRDLKPATFASDMW